MTIRSGAVLVSGLLVLVFDGPAAGQAMVEYGATSAAAAGSVGALKGISNTLNGILGNVDNAVKSEPAPVVAAPSIAPSLPARTPRPSRRKRPAKPSVTLVAAPAPPPRNYEDPQQIQAGMGYDEVIRRFGPPKLQFTGGMSSQTVTYLSKSGPIQVEFEDGKVTLAPKTKS